MAIDEKWYKLYEQMYGKEFNRLLTIGTIETGYDNFNIKNLDDLKKHIDNGFPNSEFYISLYNYDTDDNILRWNNENFDKFEKFAEKDCFMIRFRHDTHIIHEEIAEMSDIQKFMFIRRSINLGCDKDIIKECNDVYVFFKKHFDAKGILMFNGYNECLLYYPHKKLKLKEASLTYYNLLKLIKEKLNLNTLVYEQIEPLTQVVPLPGTQNNHSRLYTQLYSHENEYDEIIQKSQDKFLDESYLETIRSTPKLESFIKNFDNEISKDENSNIETLWNNI